MLSLFWLLYKIAKGCFFFSLNFNTVIYHKLGYKHYSGGYGFSEAGGAFIL